MKKIKRVVMFFLPFILVAAIAGGIFLAVKTPASEGIDNKNVYIPFAPGQALTPPETGFTPVAQNDKYVLSVNAAGQFSVLSKSSGQVFFSNPQDISQDESVKEAARMEANSMLTVDYLRTDNSQKSINSVAGSVNKKGLSLYQEEQGYSLLFDFSGSSYEFKIPMTITLEEDGVRVKVPVESIESYGENRVQGVRLLSYFGAGSAAEDGYILVPDGSGALIHFNNQKTWAEQYNQPVYGRDPVLSQKYARTQKERIHLPVFGIKKSDSAVFAVIEKGDFSAYIFANTAGSTESPLYNTAGCGFTLWQTDTVTTMEAAFTQRDITVAAKKGNPIQNAEVKYFLLEGDQCGLSDMANTYRSRLFGENPAKKTDTVPFVAELLGSVVKDTYFLGFPTRSTQALTTFDQAVEMLEALQRKGVDNTVLRYLDWNGNQGKINSSVKFLGALGGQKGYTRLTEYAAQNPVTLFPDVELLQFSENGNGLASRSDSAKTLSDIPAVQHRRSLSLTAVDPKSLARYLINPARMEEPVQSLLQNLKGMKALSVGSLGNTVYGDFKAKKVSYRDSVGAEIARQFKALSDGGLSLLSDSANAYALPYVTHVTNAPVSSSRFDVADEEVPFYQMVISGIVTYSAPPLNLNGNTEQSFLQCVSTGAAPAYQWIYEDPSQVKKTESDFAYATGWHQWIDLAANQYKKMQQNGLLTAGRLTGFTNMDNGVRKSVFESGLTVYTNFSAGEQTVEGLPLPPYEFMVKK